MIFLLYWELVERVEVVVDQFYYPLCCKYGQFQHLFIEDIKIPPFYIDYVIIYGLAIYFWYNQSTAVFSQDSPSKI